MGKSKFIKNLQDNSIEQRTDKWYKVRSKLITASDCGVLLGYNTLSDPEQIISNKLGNERFDNVYTRHGRHYEPLAIKLFEEKNKKKVYEVGLLIHQKHTFLGASPDGITSNHCLIEIKCPYTRQLSGSISLNYYAQVQLQLEVANIDKCYFYECVFKEVESKKLCKSEYCGYNEGKKNWWYLADDNLIIIDRNRDWFSRNKPIFKKFHDELKFQHKTHKKKNTGRKRKRLSIFCGDKKRRKLTKNKMKWINETKIRNSIMNNTLVDWLDLYGSSKGFEKQPNNPFTLLKFNKTRQFKTKLIGEIEEEYKKYSKRLPYCGHYSIDLKLMTQQYMEKGIPIIIQGLVTDDDNKLYTVIDLLIRSDWLQKIFDKYKLKFDTKQTLSKFSKKWCYTVVSLKYKILPFLSNGTELSNDSITRMYKAQLAFQNRVLTKAQFYDCPCAFLVGSGWKITKNGNQIKKYGEWKKLGYINLETYDNKYIDMVDKAIKWYRNVEANGHKWKLYPKPTKTELYPLIFSSNSSGGWANTKKTVANKLKDISLLWQVGPNVRNKAHKKGIYTWDNPKLTPEILGYKKDSYRANTLQKIIDVNKMKRTKVLPKKIINNLNDWKNSKKVEFYVDFETLNSLYGGRPIIYLIGLTIIIPSGIAKKYGTNNRKRDYSFVAESLTKVEEYRIIEGWIKQMKSVLKKYDLKRSEVNIYVCSKAEENFLNSAKKRHKKENSRKWNIEFTDVMEIVKSEPVVFYGCLSGFGLKAVSSAMYKSGLIPIRYDSKCTSGEVSMASAVKYYETKLSEEIDDIIRYNTLDCQVIYEILLYLRKHHS